MEIKPEKESPEIKPQSTFSNDTLNEQAKNAPFKDSLKLAEREIASTQGPEKDIGCKATYYASAFHGKKTASGERFNMYKLTAAHKTLAFNTTVKVTNVTNGKSVVVRINDRGPFTGDCCIDLSYEAAKRVQIIGPGSAPVTIEIVERP
ncbi:MAG: septal ring lytic transglycosylase RlpA family protein [Chitinivibrionales bacterium]|nr:septal ring lytic transglycosylase RlpA family protein [Chitinivibrionales bacterium]